eukprot:7079289-Pyramimonas_sp.AAC.1
MHSTPQRPQETWVYSHDGPIRRSGPIGRRKRGYILTTDQSDAGSVGILFRHLAAAVTNNNA